MNSDSNAGDPGAEAAAPGADPDAPVLLATFYDQTEAAIVAAKLRSAAELDLHPGATELEAADKARDEEARAFMAPRAPAVAVAELHEIAAASAAPSAVLEEVPEVSVPLADPKPHLLAARYRLLAVDDDPQIIKYIEAALAKHFVAFIAADNVADALKEIEANPSELVVASDLIIARSDGKGILGGIEILEKAHQRSSSMPVVLFSDYQNEEAEARARSMGVLSILQKPRKAQVQAAGKDGSGQVVHEFITGLLRVLTPYFGSGALEAPPLAGVVLPALVVPAPPSSGERDEVELPQGDQAVLVTPPAPEAAVVAPVSGSFDLGSEMTDEMDDLGESFEAELPPPLVSAGDMGVLRSMVAELIDPANRDTVTLLVLRFASHLVERAGLFLATRRSFVGLGGFSMEESSDLFVGRVRRIQIPVDMESVFSRVCHFRSMIRAPLKNTDGNQRLIEGLGGAWPQGDTVAAPLISGDRVAAILFGDNPSGKPLGITDSLEIFLQQAGLAMDRALLERKLEDTRKQRGE